jgi:hypothetical protein
MTQAEIQLLINQIVSNGNYTANELRPLLTDMLNVNITGTFTTVISTPTNSGVATASNLLYQKTFDSVVISGLLSVELGTGQNTTSFTLDLDELIEPADDWADALQVNATVSRSNGAFTGVCRILSDTGTKKLSVNVADTTTGALVPISFVAMYKTN